VVVNRWFLKQNFDFFPWECDLNYIQSQGKQKGILIPSFDEVYKHIKENSDI
jgi:hypothetical protein